MADTYHGALVQIHRMPNTKSDPSANDGLRTTMVSVQVHNCHKHTTVVWDADSVGGCGGERGFRELSVFSIQFFCDAKTALKYIKFINWTRTATALALCDNLENVFKIQTKGTKARTDLSNKNI